MSRPGREPSGGVESEVGGTGLAVRLAKVISKTHLSRSAPWAQTLRTSLGVDGTAKDAGKGGRAAHDKASEHKNHEKMDRGEANPTLLDPTEPD